MASICTVFYTEHNKQGKACRQRAYAHTIKTMPTYALVAVNVFSGMTHVTGNPTELEPNVL